MKNNASTYSECFSIQCIFLRKIKKMRARKGASVEGKNHPRDQRLTREQEVGAQKYETMQFEADGHN